MMTDRCTAECHLVRSRQASAVWGAEAEAAEHPEVVSVLTRGWQCLLSSVARAENGPTRQIENDLHALRARWKEGMMGDAEVLAPFQEKIKVRREK